MKKTELINNIEAIIEEYGSFGLGEVDAPFCPCVDDKGGLVHLLEYVDFKCRITIYDDEVEISSYEIPLKYLSKAVLKEVLNYCENYKDMENV